MRRDRFLLAILVGIGLLIILALAVFFLRGGQADYQDDSTPQGALHNYFLAIHRGDYNRAYGYIMDSAYKPEFSTAVTEMSQYFAIDASRTAVEIGEVLNGPDDERVTIRVYLTRASSSFLGGSSRETSTVTMIRQAGQWKVQEAPYPFWTYR